MNTITRYKELLTIFAGATVLAIWGYIAVSLAILRWGG